METVTTEMTEKQPDELSWDTVYHLLASDRRRVVIMILNDEPEWELGELATRVSEVEMGEGFTSGERKTRYVSLYQTHIEKLEKHGVVEWDHDTNIVRATDLVGKLAKIHKCGQKEMGMGDEPA